VLLFEQSVALLELIELTQLTDQMGSGATKESVANANLVLVPGALTVSAQVPAISTWALIALAAALALIATRMRL